MPNSPGRFSKSEHLRSPTDFRRVYDQRCYRNGPGLTLHACPNELGYSRVGLSVSRKFGPAVKRNRIRRLCREAFRLARPQLPSGLDYVIIPRGAGKTTLREVMQTLVALAQELGRKLARPTPT